jgi:hypothetical protein
VLVTLEKVQCVIRVRQVIKAKIILIMSRQDQLPLHIDMVQKFGIKVKIIKIVWQLPHLDGEVVFRTVPYLPRHVDSFVEVDYVDCTVAILHTADAHFVELSLYEFVLGGLVFDS